MSDSEKSVAYSVEADATGFEAGMRKAAESAKSAASDIDGHFKKVQEAFESALKPLKVFAAIVAGGAFFKEAISESNKLTGETMKLSKMLGIAGEEASTLRTALEDIGSNGDEYIDVFTKFARQLKSNEAGMNALGIQTRDSNGELRNSDELFTEAIKSVSGYKAGLDQNTYAQTLFGRSIDDVMKFQRLDNNLKEEAKKKNEELGLSLTQEGVNSTKAYKLAMNDVGDVLMAIKNVIGNAIKPVFTELAHWFAEVGPTAVFVFKVAIDTVVTAVEAALLVFKILGRVIGALVDPIFTVGRALKMLISGDMNGATREMQNILPNWGHAFEGLWDKIKADSSTTWNDVTNLWGKGTEVGAPKGGKKRMGDFGKSNGTGEKSKSSEWDAELAEEKLHFQERMNLEGSFAQFGKEAEAKFWQGKLALTEQGSADNVTVRRKLADLQLSIGQDAYQHELASLQAQEAGYKNNTEAKLAILGRESDLVKQRFGTESKEYEAVQKQIVEAKRMATEQLKQIDMMRAQSARDAQQAELQAQMNVAQLERDMHLITQQELLQKQAAFENTKNQIALDALKERELIALKDPDKNIVELARIHQEIEAQERQHQQRLGDIRLASLKESQQYMMGAVNSMGSGFQSVFQQTLQGTLTIQKAMQGMWQALTQAVAGALAKIAADWMVQKAMQMILGKATAAGEIAANAGVAGAAAVASTAAIPIVGPAMAPAAGAAAFAAAMSFAPMASAAGGFDIPGTLNPITQLHAREMVLPAKHADVIRAMADQGQDSQAAAGGDVHIHINATDSQSVARLFRDNGQHLVSALQQQRRNLAF